MTNELSGNPGELDAGLLTVAAAWVENCTADNEDRLRDALKAWLSRAGGERTDEVENLRATIAQLRADLAALKQSTESLRKELALAIVERDKARAELAWATECAKNGGDLAAKEGALAQRELDAKDAELARLREFYAAMIAADRETLTIEQFGESALYVIDRFERDDDESAQPAQVEPDSQGGAR